MFRRTNNGQRKPFGRRFSPGNRPRTNKNNSQFSDVSKFINKAVALEEKPYEAKNSFGDFEIDQRLKNNIFKTAYKNPTPIQDESIPHILEGRDLVGIANTGTGKTAAFLVPLLNKVLKNRGESILIMAPTRELAIQINQELIKFAFGLKIFSVCVVGGAPMFRQIKDLKRSHNFVIGTPGRLKDLAKRKSLDLSRFQTVVLDEADRMLDMGFIEDMRFLLSYLPKNKQTLFFSATLSNDIKKIINEFLNEPVNVSVKTRDTASSIDQDVVYVNGKVKLEVLHDLLIQPNFDKVLIFGKTKHGVERLSNTLFERGFKVNSIHGDKSHGQRQRALQSFKGNQVNILVATDVAARGLDISGVSHVINYELPSTYEDYIHRIGRTGRAGNIGKALTFI
ncbi:MAG: RNA helicase [Candidatus Liptonbacteria bacterium CG11_big_fil_rev_8_21_14_0_20_35_14]|uniref:RNA helicase n=1 Tax=Candidatus Liptonbacteria bacterium CG11_big_fil_rev_8_21_14_0_20_35_14 TaxID=1974634 RepID=A0A2H0N985_9BACT|nr:MAG: RNA helicase [Candidatus Liptonbacteria bacterium CG11_big_fil_rev_8_21_14_0_20_35_14]